MNYKVAPIYQGNDLIPCGITVEAKGSQGLYISETMDNIVINLDETPEKYRSNAEQIVSDFVNLFRNYSRVTEPYMKQRNELIKQNEGVVRTAKNWNDFDGYYTLMDNIKNECRRDKIELLTGHITENIYVTALDLYPSRFDYFNSGCQINFIMIKKKRKFPFIEKMAKRKRC